MDEPAARRVLLARAIESADGEGRLLEPAERDRVDLQARQEAMRHAGGREPMPRDEFVLMRAQRVIAQAAARHPQLAALQEPRPLAGWIEWLAPTGALVLGVATDAIGNPHRVDLVSLPLLGIVAWNLVMYLLLAIGLFWHGQAPSWLAHAGRWGDAAVAPARRRADAATQATLRFRLDWFRATQPLHVARAKRVLHLSAAAWALGIILSLLVRGLVVEYRVGWESTFLGPVQVDAILRVLRWPASLVAQVPDFTVSDVARLRFSDGGGAAYGAPWVWMYVGLLVTVVILPRLVLALVSALRESRLARRIAIDWDDAYFRRVVAMLNSTRMQLGLLSHRAADRERLLVVLAPEPEQLPVLVSSPAGDAMRLVDIPLIAPPEAQAQAPRPTGWGERLRAALGGEAAPPRDAVPPALAVAKAEVDCVLHLVATPDDAAQGEPLLRWLGKPVVTVAVGEGVGAALRLSDFASCWVRDRVLLDAIARALPEPRRVGWEHIVRAWEARNAARLHEAMTAVAVHALFAARQLEEVHAGSLSVKRFVDAAERESQAQARQLAISRIAGRIDASAQQMAQRMRQAYRVGEAEGEAVEHRLEERFTVQQPVHAPQAGMAGAATGAAMGASVDLLAGGLTLGAAAALGAIVGGGAAFIAAAWRNRASPSGATVVQLSDEMVEALVEAALLRYVAIVHAARGVREVDASWKAEVASRVQAQRPLLAGYWNTARTQPQSERLVEPLSHELEALARAVLKHINP